MLVCEFAKANLTINKKMEENNMKEENIEEVGREVMNKKEVKEIMPSTTKAKCHVLLQSEKLTKIAKFLGMREANTLPENVEILVTFKDTALQPAKYSFTTQDGQHNERVGFQIDSEIRYNEDASNLIMGEVFPLMLSKNAVIGLTNCIKANGNNLDLKDRSFSVFNANKQVYRWREIPNQEQLFA